MMTFDIRPLTKHDAQAMRSLRLMGLETDSFAFGASYETESLQPLSFFENRCIKTSTKTLFGAFIGGRLVGLTSIVRQESLKANHYAGIYAVYIHPDVRGRGISSALLNTAIQQAKSWQGVEFLQLGVATTNQAAIHVYQKAGFKIVGTMPCALKVEGVDYDEHLMVLDMRR